jgi:phosphatidate cytidylyltransferase
MIQIIYGIIIGYFLLGALAFFLINRRKPASDARQSYLKFGVYFLLVNLLFFSIVMTPSWFEWLAGLIVAGGLAELLLVFKRGGFRQKTFFLMALVIYVMLAVGLLYFSQLEAGLILFAFLVLSIFDSFSQISGQLFGKRKLAPRVSPNKTLGGLVGGGVTTLLSVFWLRQLYGADIRDALILAAGIVFFAFWGDLAASYFKRRYGVKDFSKALPGHGGLMDRFDSLLAGGAWVALMTLV